MAVRYYFDADILGLARAVADIRLDCTYPADVGLTKKNRRRPPCPITSTDVDDVDWLPAVASEGWVVISRDHRIQVRAAELAAVRDNHVRMFVIASREALRVWDQLEVLMRRWRDIERIAETDGPYIYALTRSSCSKLDISA